MSDFTDDVLAGAFCQECGQLMENAPGFPQTCLKCNQETRGRKSEGMPPRKVKRKSKRRRPS